MDVRGGIVRLRFVLFLLEVGREGGDESCDEGSIVAFCCKLGLRCPVEYFVGCEGRCLYTKTVLSFFLDYLELWM